MCISDWSSDVCSSDLGTRQPRDPPAPESGERCHGPCRASGWKTGSCWRASPPPPRSPGSERPPRQRGHGRSEEHTSELQSLMRISYAVFCLKKKRKDNQQADKTDVDAIIVNKTE